jgi:hypothetical protein
MIWLLSTCITMVLCYYTMYTSFHRQKFLHCKFIYNRHALTYV